MADEISTPAVQKKPEVEKLARSVWVKHSFGAFDVRPEVVAAALADKPECSREEAKQAIEAFLESPAEFAD